MGNKKKVSAGKDFRRSGRTTPTGVAPIFSRTARFRRETADSLLNLFSLWGYREIILPAFEYLEAISPGIDPMLLPKLYIMQDRGTGQILVLRPDATAQIARLTTQAFQDSLLPLRFSYSTSVFRDENHSGSRDRELHQTGLELIGDASVASDFEVLELCLSGSGIFPLKNPVLVLSHAGIQEHLFQEATAGHDSLKEVRQAFYSRNSLRVIPFFDRSSLPSVSEFAARLSGGVFNIPEALELLFGFSGSPNIISKEDLQRFSELLELLRDSRYAPSVLVDFALPPPGPYYTGMFFQLFSEESPTHLASGGRYDRLGRSFGHDLPAVGFAYNVNHIEEIIRKQGTESENGAVLVYYRPENYASVKTFSESIRGHQIPIFLIAADFLNPGQIRPVVEKILSDHEEIRAVVFFDGEHNSWYLQQRANKPVTVPSLDALVGLLLQTENR